MKNKIKVSDLVRRMKPGIVSAKVGDLGMVVKIEKDKVFPWIIIYDVLLKNGNIGFWSATTFDLVSK